MIYHQEEQEDGEYEEDKEIHARDIKSSVQLLLYLYTFHLLILFQETLRQHRLAVDVRGPNGLTLLMCACMRGDAATARALVALGADVNLPLLSSAQLSPAWERMRGYTDSFCTSNSLMSWLWRESVCVCVCECLCV